MSEKSDLKPAPPLELAKKPQNRGNSVADQPDVQGIPKVLVSALGCMAVLMFLSAVGLVIYNFWDALGTGHKSMCLLSIPIMLWGGYYLQARRGVQSAEVVAFLSCLSWAVVVVAVQTCVYSMPLWVCGLIFLAGLAVVPCIHPWRSAVVALLVGSVGELGMLGLSCVSGQVSFSAGWLGLLSMLMLWGLAGCWCYLTPRSAYHHYLIAAPLSFTLFLLIYYALIIVPHYLLPSGGDFSLNGALFFWVITMLAAVPLHVRYAHRQNRSAATPAFFGLWLCAMIAVPLAVAVSLPFLTAPLSLLSALALVYYGAVYKANRILLAGCLVFYIAVFGNVFRLGIHPVGAACVFLLLSFFTLYITMRLNIRRRTLIEAIGRVRRKRNEQN